MNFYLKYLRRSQGKVQWGSAYLGGQNYGYQNLIIFFLKKRILAQKNSCLKRHLNILEAPPPQLPKILATLLIQFNNFPLGQEYLNL